jgi:hypothetical protein
LAFGANLEIGFVTSSDSAFSRTYVDLGADALFNLNEDWTALGEIGLMQNTFPGRPLSQSTIVSRKRGFAAGQNAGENYEAHAYFYLLGEVTRHISEDLDAAASLNMASQTSRSGYQNYSVTELYARIIWSF